MCLPLCSDAGSPDSPAQTCMGRQFGVCVVFFLFGCVRAFVYLYVCVCMRTNLSKCVCVDAIVLVSGAV